MDISIPTELFQLILDYADFLIQIRLRCVCKTFHQKLEVCVFYNIHPRYLVMLSDSILQAYPFITILNANQNLEITNLNHMTKLESLFAYGNTQINDHGISNLNLKELAITDCPKITNLNHMTRLEWLYAGGCCGVTDAGISKLNLKVLDAWANHKITNVTHLTRLEILNAGMYCGIDDKGIEGLNLKKLYSMYNPKITKCLSLNATD